MNGAPGFQRSQVNARIAFAHLACFGDIFQAEGFRTAIEQAIGLAHGTIKGEHLRDVSSEVDKVRLERLMVASRHYRLQRSKRFIQLKYKFVNKENRLSI